mmetsp:Transcript_13542/g.32093  ORF Transcript_13542/g.32093 Transcript_13542/m.32093 type:complete len:203 (-) Transcript_13542:17-625(-)
MAHPARRAAEEPAAREGGHPHRGQRLHARPRAGHRRAAAHRPLRMCDHPPRAPPRPQGAHHPHEDSAARQAVAARPRRQRDATRQRPARGARQGRRGGLQSPPRRLRRKIRTAPPRRFERRLWFHQRAPHARPSPHVAGGVRRMGRVPERRRLRCCETDLRCFSPETVICKTIGALFVGYLGNAVRERVACKKKGKGSSIDR